MGHANRVDLDDLDLVAKLDPSGMLAAIDRFPEAFLTHPREMTVELKRRVSPIESLVLMGMGGSASAADVTVDWLRGSMRIPALVHREPDLPAFVGARTLFIGISYSGETLETLQGFRAAHRRGSRLVGIGTGGKLSKLCDQFGSPFVELESALAPRAALSQMIVAIATVLSRLELVRSTSHEIAEAGKELALLRNRFHKETPTDRNPAKRLASRLLGRFVVLYSLQRMSSVARRFKNQLAENSKVAAKFDLLPEACHNEIEVWPSQDAGLLPVIIRDWKESGFERLILRAFRNTLASSMGSAPLEVNSPNRGGLSSLVLPIFLLDYVSVYLAMLRAVDPTPTDGISGYKWRLESQKYSR